MRYADDENEIIEEGNIMEMKNNVQDKAKIRPGVVVRLLAEDREMVVETVGKDTAICAWCEGDELVRRNYLLGLLVPSRGIVDRHKHWGLDRDSLQEHQAR